MSANRSRLPCFMALLLLIMIFTASAAGVQQDWSRTFGGNYGSGAWSLQRCDDGGYIIAGYTCSLGQRGDLWLVKTDETGKEQWNRSYGGSGEDVGYYVKQTNDGGYIVVGSTESYGIGKERMWLIKLDSNGNREWDRTFGGFVSSSGDGGWSVDTVEDGYIIAGYTQSFGAGGKDLWLVKTDLTGRELWQRTFGGSKDDVGLSVLKTQDNGYIVAGRTASFGSGGDDIWLLKVDSVGNEQWNRTFGGDMDDVAFQVIEVEDGYILTGRVESSGGKKAFLLKTDLKGARRWDRTYGQESTGISVQKTDDGGFIVAGSTDTEGGGKDALLIKTDSSGKEQWIMPLGGPGDDIGTAVVESTDGGYILAGITSSFEAGGENLWLTKLIPADRSENASRNVTEIEAPENSSIDANTTAADTNSPDIENPDIVNADMQNAGTENADIQNIDNEKANTGNADNENSNTNSSDTRNVKAEKINIFTDKSISIPKLEGHSILGPPALFKK